MDALLSEIMVAPTIPWAVLVLRLAGALLLCGLIGLERESRDRPAGLRTHMMVGLASAVYCIVLLEMIAAFGEGEGQLRLDPVRLIEAVTSGVAFLAAGMIVFAKGEVRHSDHNTIVLHEWHEVLMNRENQSRTMRNVAFID